LGTGVGEYRPQNGAHVRWSSELLQRQQSAALKSHRGLRSTRCSRSDERLTAAISERSADNSHIDACTVSIGLHVGRGS
jgi:hypothetical protein